MRLLPVPLLLGLVLSLSAQSPRPDLPLPDPGDELGLELELRAGEFLVDYAWDALPAVPFLRTDPRVHLSWGERGLRDDQLLYLPGNTALEGSFTGALVRTRLDVTLVEGRFGYGLGFAHDSYLHVDLPAGPTELGWSLHLWLRPEPAAFGRALLTLNAGATLSLRADGRVQATLDGGASLVAPAEVASGAWTFVDLSYDRRQTRQMRLTVADTSVNLVLWDPAPELVARRVKLGDLGRDGLGFVGTLDELAIETHPLSTARALELGRPAPSPGSHRLRWSTNLGQRTASPAAGITSAAVLDDAADFARGERVAAEVVGGELSWVVGHWKRLETRGAPAARTTHALVALGGGRVLTYGGETRDTHLWPMVNTDDTWVFDGASWSLVPSPDAPPPRCHIPLAYSPDHELVLLHGGWRNDRVPGQIYDDTWVFHVRDGRWEQRFPSGSSPGRKSDHGLVYIPSQRKFLMLSGRRAWFYDPEANHWEERPRPASFLEDGRPVDYVFASSTSAALDPRTDEVLVYGGSYGSTADSYVDFTALYDVAANVYTVVHRPVRPSPRARCGFAFDPVREQFVLYGGVQDQYSQRKDDLWAFDPATREWRLLLASNGPGRRGGYYGMAYDQGTDRFVLACGRASFDRWLDDTWELTLDERRAGTALYTFDRQRAGRAASWFADAVTPGDSRVQFLFRDGETPSAWSGWQPAPGLARFVQVVVVLEPGTRGEVPRVSRMGWR